MRVSANLETGYKFKLDPSDFQFLPEGFKSYLTPDGDGVTYKALYDVDDVLFVAIPFCNVVGVPFPAVRTYKPKTKFTALSDHGLTVNAEFNSLITIAEATIPKPYQWIKGDGRTFHANHIPQLFQTFNGAIISGVDGVYDWRLRKFKGSIYAGMINAGL